MLSMFPLYIFLFNLDPSASFPYKRKAKKRRKFFKNCSWDEVGFFCAIPVAIDFIIVFRNSVTIL